jgi:hypothetical protein
MTSAVKASSRGTALIMLAASAMSDDCSRAKFAATRHSSSASRIEESTDEKSNFDSENDDMMRGSRGRAPSVRLTPPAEAGGAKTRGDRRIKRPVNFSDFQYESTTAGRAIKKQKLDSSKLPVAKKMSRRALAEAAAEEEAAAAAAEAAAAASALLAAKEACTGNITRRFLRVLYEQRERQVGLVRGKQTRIQRDAWRRAPIPFDIAAIAKEVGT